MKKIANFMLFSTTFFFSISSIGHGVDILVSKDGWGSRSIIGITIQFSGTSYPVYDDELVVKKTGKEYKLGELPVDYYGEDASSIDSRVTMETISFLRRVGNDITAKHNDIFLDLNNNDEYSHSWYKRYNCVVPNDSNGTAYYLPLLLSAGNNYKGEGRIHLKFLANNDVLITDRKAGGNITVRCASYQRVSIPNDQYGKNNYFTNEQSVRRETRLRQAQEENYLPISSEQERSIRTPTKKSKQVLIDSLKPSSFRLS